MTNIRPPAFAGQFYPEDEDTLKSDIANYLKEAKPKEVNGQIKALISPHAGYQYSAPVAAYGYKLLGNCELAIDKCILIGPSHQMMFQGIALTNFSFWKTPLGLVYVSKLYEKLKNADNFQLLSEVHAFEHSIEVQLPFLQTVLEEFKIIPIITGRIDNHKEIAKTLNDHLDSQTLIIVSSDLSHYLSYDEATKTDAATISQILNLDTYIDHEQACGADGIIILLELAKRNGWKVELLDYRNSGDTAGDKSKVVGYSSIVFYES